MNTASITHQALSLPVQQRAELAAQLLASLDALSESEIEPLWFQEAAHRAAEMDQGLSRRVSSEEVSRQAATLLK
jgi:Putative addiction module component